MKSDIIKITNHGDGFESALNETQKAAAYEELTAKETIQIELLTEEILRLEERTTPPEEKQEP